ncbi:MAG: hypothetical protein WC700_09000 [Gemmatimonadaceae bacterium]|jgi:hypothetical protein
MANARPVYRYQIPEACGCPFKEIGMVELNTNEEQLAYKAARNEPSRMAFELVKRSLWEADGALLKDSDGSRERTWNELGAKARTLCASAWNQIHNPDDVDTEGFLLSRSVKV